MPRFAHRFSAALVCAVLLGPALACGVQAQQPINIHSQTNSLPPGLLVAPHWGQGGPWANQKPHAPHPKPVGWVDPEPSRWPWTGERDPYDYADRSAP
jgi:hypothetical protein